MAAAFEGFSIREFASRMRSENVAKSWPFGGDVHKEQIESILPPITVTKFRWWLHELEYARSCHDCSSDDDAIQGKNSKVDAETLEAAPLGFTLFGCLGDPSNSAILTTHAGNCMVSEDMKHRAKDKSKSKAPKKRSIVEIFAVAAQIEATEVSTSRTTRASSGRKSKSNSSNRRKKKKKKKSLLDKHQLLSVSTKFKKRKKNHGKISLNKCESSYKIRREIVSRCAKSFKRPTDGMYTYSISDGSLHRKNSQLKSSSSRMKYEANMPSKFSKRQKKLHNPVHGILKKQGKFLVNNYDSQNVVDLEKRVKFVDNVEVQSSPQNSPTSIQKSDGYARLLGVDKLIARDEEFGIVNIVSGNDGDPVFTESGNRIQVTLENEHLPSTSNQGQGENYSDLNHGNPHDCNNNLIESFSTRQVSECVDLHASIIKGKSVVVDDSTAKENSGFLTSVRGTHDTGTSLQTLEIPLGCSTGPSYAVCGMSIMESPRTSSQSTPSCLVVNENLNRSISLRSHSTIEDMGTHSLACQQRPINFLSCASPFPGQWNIRPCSLTDECIHKNLWGLPLNSRGELIQMHSTSSSNFVGKHSSCMMSDSLSEQNIIGQHYTDEHLGSNSEKFGQSSCSRGLNLFPMHNCDMHGPIADNFWQNPERHVSSSCSLNTDLNLLNVSFDVCGQQGYDYMQHQVNQTIPPLGKEIQVSTNITPVTMRLMGKDVAVARSSSRDLEDENIWMDKEMIIEHHQQDKLTQSTSQKSNGSANYFVEHEKNLRCRSLVKAHNSLLLNPHINWPSDSVPQRDRFPFLRSSNHELPPHSHVSFDFTDLREPTVADPRVALPSLSRGSSQCIHCAPQQNYYLHPPLPRASSFDLPFLCHNCGEYNRKETFFRSPFRDAPAWLRPSDQVRTLPTVNYLAFPDEIERSYQRQTLPSRFNSSMTFATYDPPPPPHLRGPFGPSPAVRSQLLEAVPGIKPFSTDKVSYGSRIEQVDRMKLPAFGVKTLDLCARTKKRPAVNYAVDPFSKLHKMPNLGPLKNLSIGTYPRKETFTGEVECGSGGEIRLDSSSGKAGMSVYLPDGSGSFTGTERLSREAARPCPTKLSAGARHVLRSTKTAGQDGSRPNHPMLYFGGSSNYIRMPDCQAKTNGTYEV
ncbi:hypothetical protein SAY86_020633 [Trapa natans]|uniref:Uncharacterized protein n=1 Tax=Trapa natans TaxID=22666 RepID=A0AAN7LQT4_TRANT|nr:hypothetical protein SAY86_020633 [Trapa natans]